MTSEALDHDEQEHPVLSRALVNFTQKAIDNIKEANDKGPQQPQRIEDVVDDDDDDEADIDKGFVEDEEEWTEFKDGFGRTRRCLKSDLPSFMSRDDTLSRPITNPEMTSSVPPLGVDPMIEIKRQKWEKDQEEVTRKDSVHYQDVLYDGNNHRFNCLSSMS